MASLWIEAESFTKLGGWLNDSQCSEQMGSAFIMAHGLGKPVEDAETEREIPESGTYTVWARTRDWTAVWHRGTPAGRFTLSVDGKELPEILGTNGENWAWQKAGEITLSAGKHKFVLHDLTGFDARCDAIFLSTDTVPANGREELAAQRRAFVSPETEEDDTVYDIAVIGGGVAGLCTALSAERLGLKALLVHDRPMLGGCNSSEVRVCMGGRIHMPPYTAFGNIVKEIAPVAGSPDMFAKELYEDERKTLAFLNNESKGTCKLATNQKVDAIETEDGRITSVETFDTVTGRRRKYRAKLFSDCTGDGIVCRLAGCETMYGREAKDEFGEALGADSHEQLVMGHSLRWYSHECDAPSPFPDIDFAIPMTDETCLHVKNGDWEQETGFRRHMANETEYIRDFGLLAIYSNWSFQKNHSAKKAEYANSELEWISHIGGKRESYRVVGDFILTQNEIENHEILPDATASMTWSIDMHFPECGNEEQYGEAFRSFAYHRGIVTPYPVPYRCLYARDVKNLFLGGRIVSMTHVAFSAVRVMRTLGQLGEAVGIAAEICARHACEPRDVYEKYLPELVEGIKKGVPSPDAFDCRTASEEAYHFKDAGWFTHGEAEDDDFSSRPMYDKVKKNIKRLGIKHKYKEFFDDEKLK